MKQKKILYLLTTVLTVLFGMASCTPDSHELGEKDLTPDDLVAGIAYTVEHDPANANIVYLKSQLPSNYQILWDHPQGRSQASEVKLELPFAGDYQARMGVQTRGGIVYGPYTNFNVDTFCSDFVNDPLWTALTGGVGHSKKWILDVDGEGTCRYFVGPLYFYGTNDSWNSVTMGEAVGGDSWSWAADWAGNSSWIFGNTGAMDYGSMTFSLENGATVTVDDKSHGRVQTGTFSMDAANHTMRITDAQLLHDPGRDNIVSQWGNITILALTDNYMQLAVLRDTDPSEGPCLLSYNFISEEYKEYADNNIVAPTPSITLAEDWRDYIEPKTQKEVTYKLSEENPFDWADLYGVNKGITYETAVSGIEDLTLVMNSGTHVYTVTTPDGTTVKGTYTLSDEGVYTFSDGLPVVQLAQSGNNDFKANSDNTLRILSYQTDDYSGAVSDLWLGSNDIDDQGNVYQYKAYHFCPVVAGSDMTRYTANLYFNNSAWSWDGNAKSDNVFITGDGDYTFTFDSSFAESDMYLMYLDIQKILRDYPNADATIKDVKIDGISIAFDDAAIDRSAGDDANTLRRYVLNPWNDANYFVANGISLGFSSSFSITIHVTMDTGSPFITE